MRRGLRIRPNRRRGILRAGVQDGRRLRRRFRGSVAVSYTHLANHLQQALRAHFLFHRDKDYVVVGGEVKIVDEFTGRIMEGRRYSEGLHQALEAKERVRVREENQTLATITLQNYFRLYDKLSGMTGTAMTEDAEFRQIYHLPVVAIPANKTPQGIDENLSLIHI